MPLEGHWQRTNTPLYKLSRRERVMAAAGLLAVCAGLLVAVILGLHHHDTPVPRGCIDASVPGVMGGSNALDACGARALRLCDANASLGDAYARAIEVACRRAGIG
jgi:hypothetical protein